MLIFLCNSLWLTYLLAEVNHWNNCTKAGLYSSTIFAQASFGRCSFCFAVSLCQKKVCISFTKSFLSFLSNAWWKIRLVLYSFCFQSLLTSFSSNCFMDCWCFKPLFCQVLHMITNLRVILGSALFCVFYLLFVVLSFFLWRILYWFLCSYQNFGQIDLMKLNTH